MPAAPSPPTAIEDSPPDFRYDLKPGAQQVRSFLRGQGHLGRRASVVIGQSGRCIEVVTDNPARLQVPRTTDRGVPVVVRANNVRGGGFPAQGL